MMNRIAGWLTSLMLLAVCSAVCSDAFAQSKTKRIPPEPVPQSAPQQTAPQPAAPAPKASTVPGPTADGGAAPAAPMRFDDCVRMALKRSPAFAASSIEIDVRKLDVLDAKFKMLPSFNVQVGYLLNNADNRADFQPFSVNFTTGDYDPIKAYFSIGAAERIVKLAVTEHLRIIADGIHNLARGFLRMDHLNRVLVQMNDLVDTSKKEKAYAQSRMESGFATTLDVLVAEQRGEKTQFERIKLESKKTQALESLKKFLGVRADQDLALELKDAKSQVMGRFNPAEVTFAKAKTKSIEFRTLELQRQLRKDNLLAAYAAFMPKFSFGIVQQYSYKDDTNIYTGQINMNTPIWDWGERYRDVQRKKHQIRQVEATSHEKDFDLAEALRVLDAEVKEKSAELKLAQANAQLADLEKQQVDIRYKAGTALFPEYLRGIQQSFNERANASIQELVYNETILKLRHLSGDLYSSYVDIGNY